jgi:nucleoside-diphosphate-sugar epimerase
MSFIVKGLQIHDVESIQYTIDVMFWIPTVPIIERGILMKVFVTGAFGWTARAIIEKLHKEGFEVGAFDIEEKVPSYLKEITNNIYIGDVASQSSLEQAMKGYDYVIHLAVAIEEGAYQSAEVPFQVNVKGTYHVLEVARKLGVKKMIIMSEAPVHVDLKLKERETFNAETDWRSSDDEDHLYDLTKRLQETIAKDYSETFHMNITVLRPGHIVDGQKHIDPTGKPLSDLAYCQGGWVCKYDLATATLKALTRKSSGYEAFHIISSYQAKQIYDIERTERLLNMKFSSNFSQY